MANKKSNEKREYDDILDKLLDLPISNLEDRIRSLEQEINCRNNIKDDVLTILNTNRIRLKEELWHLRYIPVFNPAFNHISHLKREIALLETGRINEWLACFRDISRLNERLQQAKEELKQEKGRRRLIE